MSILCIICKEKLISHVPGGSFGSLNQMVENVLISTSCGHLYHFECLQSWFRTQRRKYQIQGFGDSEPNICPSCQTPVKDEEQRRIFPLEDHREALEKAKLLERQENLEIYCHQLEIQIQQLAKENDVLLNAMLTPAPTSPMDNFDTIVKNDRVMWMRPGETPVYGVVLSIFKKEGQLCAKIKLDRKIRTNQRTSRIFSSFRLDKKQELTVPFDEIVLEKDVNQNVISGPNPSHGQQINGFNGDGLGGRSYSSANIPQQRFPPTSGQGGVLGSFRSSTMSLPDESRRLFGIKESAEDLLQIPTIASNSKVPFLNRSISYSPGFPGTGRFVSGSISSVTPEPPSRDISSPQSISNSNASIDQQRDYVYITPSWMKNGIKPAPTPGRLSPPDGKSKHVTFADDPAASKPTVTDLKLTNEGQVVILRSSSGASSSTVSIAGTDSSIPASPTKVIGFAPKSRKKYPPPAVPPVPKPRPRVSLSGSDSSSSASATTETPKVNPDRPLSPKEEKLSVSKPFEIPELQLSHYETITRTNVPLPCTNNASMDSSGSISIIELLQDFEESDPTPDTTNSCFDATLLSLLYRPIGFDSPMATDDSQDNELSRKVKWIIRETFVKPLRQHGCVRPNYSTALNESLGHLCSGEIDVEELMTILFEFTFKMTPFINYSLAMCDYLHQFFIDFTDNTKIRTVQNLLEKSLTIQDNLKLEGRPSPALILQMRHSDEGIIHYNAVIPNLTMNIEHLCENGQWESKKKCYCDNVATLECKVCNEIHGESAILFCERCKELLDGIHQGNGHELEISPVSSSFKMPSTLWSLTAIICFKDEHYSVFLRDGGEIYSPWIFVHSINGGKLQAKQLPGFGYWLENLVDKHASLNTDQIPPLLLKVLKYARLYIYLPETSSSI